MLTPTGTLLNERYRLDDEIGRGGMGVVFQGWDDLLQRKVAIKVLNQESLGGGGTERLLEEARVIARLDHPNIVTLFDAGEVDSDPFLVMQLVEGRNLGIYESLDLHEIIGVGIQICSALSHAHKNGIIHRDLKPDNIFLSSDSIGGMEIQNHRVKIVDFGIAHSDLASMTIQGEIIGTVSYMAPEQALGQETSPQTDLYALGVILYELSTGELPFSGDNPLNVISQHINAPVKPPSETVSDFPEELDKLILQLMNKSPGDRPVSALEVEKMLRGALLADGDFDHEAIISPERQTVEHNLPEQLTSFVGREQEIDEISNLIAQDSCRLLTLVGPGGIGKTRLAIEAAAHNLGDYEEGVFFISLAAISGPDFILPAIAENMGITLQTHGSVDPESQLFDFLANRNSLLMLDNYEHLMDGTEVVGNLLRRAPGVKLIVTSRQRLNVQGEWTFNLGGLAVPESGPQDGESHDSAVELFIERARLADARFSLEKDELQHVIRICQLVAGSPLGVELAAAWVSVLSPQEIAGEIEKNLDFLASSGHDIPKKHRSMRAAFDYSWILLSGEQRQVFKKLSIFRGSFSRQAAADVADAGLMDLSVLVDKSFIRRSKKERYEIHELLRQYGQEKLHEISEEHSEIGDRHSQYYLDYLEQRESKIVGEMQLETRDEIQVDLENVRASIRWGIANGNEQGVQSAFQVLSSFYFIQGYYEAVESYRNFARNIEDHYETGYDHEKPGSLMYFTARANQVFYLSMLGSIEKADEIARKILPGLRELDIRPEIRNCLMSLGINASFRGEYEKAGQDLKESLNIAERYQNSFWIVGSKIWLGWVYYEQGDRTAALQEWQEGEQISVEMNNRLLLAFVQSKLALLGEETGDYENAIKIQLQARENFEQFDDQVGVGYATSRLALSLMGIGEYREAKRFGQEALQNYREMNHRWGIPASMCRIGFAEIELDEHQAAWMHLREALDLSLEAQIGTLVLYSLIGLAQLLASGKDVEQGVKILSFVVVNPITPSLYREMAAKSLGEIENKFPADEFKAASKAGEKADVEEIVNSLPSSLTEP